MITGCFPQNVFDKGLLDPPKVKKSRDVNVVCKGLQLAHESH